MSKPFHLTLTNNVTGEVYRDTDIDAIIGTIHIDENETGGIFMTSCSGIALGQTLDAVKTVLKRVYSEHPELEMLEALVRARMTQSVEEHIEK